MVQASKQIPKKAVETSASKSRRPKRPAAPPPPRVSRWQRLLNSKRFAYAYAGLALLVLLGSTSFWAVLSARVQNSNADQAVNSLLFENASTFHQAQFPSQHTFLIKWPLFYLIHVLGATPEALIGVTLGLVLLTVGSLAFILWRIERRPLVVGTLWLALASVLLLVPTQPYAGALLPVNLAMVAGRNIEYAVLLAAVYLMVRRPQTKNLGFWTGVTLLALLIASDKLFMTVVVGGTLLAMISYVLLQRWQQAYTAARLLLASVVASILSFILLGVIQATGLTHIVGQTSAGPYGLVSSPKALTEGIFYAVTSIFTNLGANPASGTTIIRQMPAQAGRTLFSVASLPTGVNLLIAALGLWAVVRLAKQHLLRRAEDILPSKASFFAMYLVWISLAALGAFIVSNHYYAADARYLGVVCFTTFVALAVASRSKSWNPVVVVLTGLLLVLSIGAGLLVNHSQYLSDQQALQAVNQRNLEISQALTQHSVQELVGDYWRVIPVKLAAHNRLNVVPLETCTTARQVLSSQAWQPDLSHRSFAYLLSYDQKLTDYPSCQLSQVRAAYGRPNSSLVISGSLSQPQELLLFYDHGAKASSPARPATIQPVSTTDPIPLSDLPHLTCAGSTIMNIVAHQDDDLLFINPDLLHEIHDGQCIRTIYVTAGDAGNGEFFWLGRQQGSEAAYSNMLGFHDIWIERTVMLDHNAYLTIANPRGNSNVSLIFMHLPDGNITGQGFKALAFQSLAKLDAGKLTTIKTVDGHSSYTGTGLVTAITSLMQAYQPTEIHTQASYTSRIFPDHSDHMAVGRFVKKAYQRYEIEQRVNLAAVPIKYYIGYPIHAFAENVFGDDLAAKQAAFFEYAKHDGGVCHDLQECKRTPTYFAYLHRQYQNPE